MSRNLSSTRCVYCNGDITLKRDICSINDALRAIQQEEECECQDCCAQYRLISIQYGVEYDLCFLHSNNDEPDTKDMPLLKITRDKEGNIIEAIPISRCAICDTIPCMNKHT